MQCQVDYMSNNLVHQTTFKVSCIIIHCPILNLKFLFKFIRVKAVLHLNVLNLLSISDHTSYLVSYKGVCSTRHSHQLLALKQ